MRGDVSLRIQRDPDFFALNRLEGRDSDAMRLYEEAIHSAGENGLVQNEGGVAGGA